MIIDRVVSVIPAQAGTHVNKITPVWIPACAGMTVIKYANRSNER